MSVPQGIVPVVSLDSAESACLLADIFLDEGLYQMEVTLRTPQAIDIIKTLVSHFPELLVGAGTVLTVDQLHQAWDAGARFFVSPIHDRALGAEARRLGLDYIPAAATPSEAWAAFTEGWSVVKFFPAEVLGGLAWIRSVSAPLPQIRWMPTGGITLEKARAYLELPQVTAVGIGEVARSDEIRDAQWDTIRRKARLCGELHGHLRR